MKGALKGSVLFVYAGGVEEVLLRSDARDNCTEPYINLKKSFEKKGCTFEWELKRTLETYDWIIFLNVYSAYYAKPLKVILRKARDLVRFSPIKSIFSQAVQKGLNNKLVLILTEPPSVCPENYDLNFHRHFKYVFTWKSDLADGKRYHRFHYPTTSVFPLVDEIPFLEKKLLVDVSGNKYSKHKRELYTERRRTIQFFEENYPEDFDLFGTGWNELPPPRTLRNVFSSNFFDPHHYTSYRGQVKHKWEVLPRYKFTLCYENILGENDYITNRFFDILRCKSVPIYWGAPNIGDYVAPGTFIGRENFRTNQELALYLKGMNESEYGDYLAKGRDYLESEAFKLFLSDHYVNTIFSTLRIA